MAGTSTVATPEISCSRRWGWVEIHWTDKDPTNWKIPQYTCPILEEANITDDQKNVALSKLYSAKNVKPQSPVSAGQSEQSFANRDAFICTSVTQYIIIEIQPIVGIEYTIMDSLPFVYGAHIKGTLCAHLNSLFSSHDFANRYCSLALQ